MRGDLTTSAERTTLALRAGRAAGNHTLAGRALNNLAAAAIAGGDLRAALRLFRESLASSNAPAPTRSTSAGP